MEAENKAFKLPENLLLGVATAATQIEGGDRNNNWYEWAEKGGAKDKSSPFRANNHWELWQQDIQLMSDMHIQIYRMGFEWSRIEPEQGKFSEEAISRYRDEIKLLHEKNIKVLVTIQHFNTPLWFEKNGGFLRSDAPAFFEDYVRFVIEKLYDLVDEWITINEPNVYALGGFLQGIWPPGIKNFGKMCRVYRNMALCHITAYRIIHSFYEEKSLSVKVGVANHLAHFVPLNPENPMHRFTTWFIKKGFQLSITDAFARGKFSFPVAKPTFEQKKLYLSGNKNSKYYDFMGINYYARYAVKAFSYGVHPGTPQNDLGWEIYPDGIRVLSEYICKKYKAPVYITENGTCDAKDAFRTRFIYDHLRKIAESGLPIERYYHWTFIDNWEWAEGETAPFGLVKLDFETQERTIRKSGHFYTEIIDNHGVTEEMYEKYLKED